MRETNTGPPASPSLVGTQSEPRVTGVYTRHTGIPQSLVYKPEPRWRDCHEQDPKTLDQRALPLHADTFLGALPYRQMLGEVEYVDDKYDKNFVMVFCEHYTMGASDDQISKYLNEFVDNPRAFMIFDNSTEPLEKYITEALKEVAQRNPDAFKRACILVNDQFTKQTYINLLATLDCECEIFINSNSSYVRIMWDHEDTDVEPARIGMYTRAYKRERALLYFEFFQRGLLKDIWYSFWRNLGYGDGIFESTDDILASLFPDPLSERYMPRLHDRLHNVTQEKPGIVDKFRSWLDQAPHLNSKTDSYMSAYPLKNMMPFVHIVVETLQNYPRGNGTDGRTYEPYVDDLCKVFITEKTYILMLQRKAFIIYGQHGVLDKLHAMGFKTFNDFWDEESLKQPNIQDRIDAICDIVEKLLKMSDSEFKQMQSDMQSILDHNHNIATLYAKQDTADHLALTERLREWVDPEEDHDE